ncbi:Protein FAR1-RELATED SEQUENCE 6 [Bienertia sinuspersici]
MIAVIDKGVVEVEVDVMVVELEDSSRILDLETPVEDVLLLEEKGEGSFYAEGGDGVDADVVGDVGYTLTKECSDVVALAPPTVGMVFSSWQEADTYYKAYASQQGFGVVRAAWSGYKAKDKTRQYSRIEEDPGVKTLKNCECPVKIYASVNAEYENEWEVRKVVNEHQNHNPTPLKSRFIGAHRKEEMNCHVKRKLKLRQSAGVKVALIHNMLARERNGPLEMAINKRDIRNELYKEKNRAAYEEFNDVVCFDTTYLTNQYELPFANFVVLTDEAAAMRNALRSTMPETRHRWCIWLITEKFSQKLGKCKGYNEFKDELLNAIYDSLSVPELESNWMAIINKHELEDNVWLDGMKTTHRVESIHSFDDYVNKHTTLVEFAKMYCQAMGKRAKTERQYDAHSETFIRQIACGFSCEFVFQRYYTDMKFKEIQRECSRIMFLRYFQNVVTSDNVTEYTFADRVWCRNKETKKEYLTQYKRNYRVCFDMTTKLAECECSLFNHSSIRCRHMIKLNEILSEEVSNRYIMRRWRKDVLRKHTRVKVAYHDPSKTEHIVSCDEMQLTFEPICSKASVFKDTKQLVLEFLELLDIRVESDKPPSSAGNEGNVKDPPRKAKPAHRITDHRYYSAVEKAIKAKPKWKTKAIVSKGTSHLIDVNQGAIVSDIPMF